MENIPYLKTRRLTMRPFTLEDAPDVQRLAGDREIAATTIRIPHPYEDGMAEEWIATHQDNFATGRELSWAITRQSDGVLLGAVGLIGLDREHSHVELGYWIGKPFWGEGYATEAARAAVDYGFRELKVDRVHAHCFAKNAVSSHILTKIGMSLEGQIRQHIRKWDEFQDLDMFGILRNEWEQK